MVMVFVPSTSVIDVLNDPPVPIVTEAPFTVSSTVFVLVTVPLTVTADWFVIVPLSGEVTVIAGGTELLCTVRDTVVLFPAASVAITVMTLVPSTNEKGYENAPAGLVETVVPFIVTVTAVES
jgi:hypothetical protein